MRIRIFFITLVSLGVLLFLAKDSLFQWTARRILSSFLTDPSKGEIQFEKVGLKEGRFVIESIFLKEKGQEILIEEFALFIKCRVSSFALEPHVEIKAPHFIFEQEGDASLDISRLAFLFPSRFLHLKLDIERGVLSGMAEEPLFYSLDSGDEPERIGKLEIALEPDALPILSVICDVFGSSLHLEYDFETALSDRLLPFFALFNPQLASGWSELKGQIKGHGIIEWDGKIQKFLGSVEGEKIALSHPAWKIRGNAEKMECHLDSNILIQIQNGNIAFNGDPLWGISNIQLHFDERGENGFDFTMQGEIFEDHKFISLEAVGQGGHSNIEGFWGTAQCRIGNRLEAECSFCQPEYGASIVHADFKNGNSEHLLFFKPLIQPLQIKNCDLSGKITAWFRNGSLEKIALDEARVENCLWNYPEFKLSGSGDFFGNGEWGSKGLLQNLTVTTNGGSLSVFEKKWSGLQAIFNMTNGKWDASWIKAGSDKLAVEVDFSIEDKSAELLIKGPASEIVSLFAPAETIKAFEQPSEIYASIEKKGEGWNLLGKMVIKDQGEIAFGIDHFSPDAEGWFKAEQIPSPIYLPFVENYFDKISAEGKISLIGKWGHSSDGWLINGVFQTEALWLAGHVPISDAACQFSFDSSKGLFVLQEGAGKAGLYSFQIPYMRQIGTRQEGKTIFFEEGDEALSLEWTKEGDQFIFSPTSTHFYGCPLNIHHLKIGKKGIQLSLAPEIRWETLSTQLLFLKNFGIESFSPPAIEGEAIAEITYDSGQGYISFHLENKTPYQFSVTGEKRKGILSLSHIGYQSWIGSAVLMSAESGWSLNKLEIAQAKKPKEIIGRIAVEKIYGGENGGSLYLKGAQFSFSPTIAPNLQLKFPKVLTGRGDFSISPRKIVGKGSLQKGVYPLGGKNWELDKIEWEWDGATWYLGARTFLGDLAIETALIYTSPAGNLQVKHKSYTLSADFALSSQGFIWKSIDGELPGIEAHLRSVSSTTLKGKLMLDPRKIGFLLTEKMNDYVEKWKIGNGFAIEGVFAFPDRFQGRIVGKNAEIFGYILRELQADVRVNPNELVIDTFWISDPALTLYMNHFRCFQEAHWMMEVPHLEIKNFRPSSLIRSDGSSKPKPFAITDMQFTGIQGYLDQRASWTGRGSMRFINAEKRESNLLDLPYELIKTVGLDPALLNPAKGELELHLEDEKIYISSIQNVSSEDGRCQFYLSDEREPCYFDLDGHLHIDLKMRQEALLKLAEPFILSIRGTFDKPSYSLKK